jgi:hypothetical protein
LGNLIGFCRTGVPAARASLSKGLPTEGERCSAVAALCLALGVTSVIMSRYLCYGLFGLVGATRRCDSDGWVRVRWDFDGRYVDQGRGSGACPLSFPTFPLLPLPPPPIPFPCFSHHPPPCIVEWGDSDEAGVRVESDLRTTNLTHACTCSLLRRPCLFQGCLAHSVPPPLSFSLSLSK